MKTDINNSDLKDLEYRIESYEDLLECSINKLLSFKDYARLTDLLDLEFTERPYQLSLFIDWYIKPKDENEVNPSNFKIIGLLRALSHTENNMTKLLYFSLVWIIDNSNDIDCREYAIKGFEKWGDSFGAVCLLKTKQDSTVWMQDYKMNVASDLIQNEINDILNPKKPELNAIDFLKAKGYLGGILEESIASLMEEYYNIKLGR